MNLDDNLEKLKEDVPEVNPYLETKIYQSVNHSKKQRNPFFNKLTFSIAGITLIVFLAVLGPFISRNREKAQVESSAILLKDVTNPSGKKAPASIHTFREKLNDFSGDLSYAYLQSIDKTENAILSPASIFSALAMATECSSQDSKEEILHALGMDYKLLKENYGYFYQEMNGIIRDYKDTTITEKKMTNSIWLNRSLSYNEDCIHSLAEDYYCYSHHVNFEKSRLASKYIHNFIIEATHGLIDLNLDLSPETIFVLLNTLYLKDSWGIAELDLTDKVYNFKNFDQSITQKKFLKGTYQLGKTLEKENYKQFYTAAENTQITFIVPTNGASIDDVFTKEVISNASVTSYDETGYYKTRCIFPEFEANSQQYIGNLLQDQFSIQKVFMPEAFTQLTSPNAFCSNIVHVAKLKVDRKGIEGAAVTALMTDGSAPRLEILEDFVIDQSFGFIASSNGSNLFSGIIRHI